MVKAILFDFGGTLDSGGDHWYHVLYDILQRSGLAVDRDLYKKAFAIGERTLATLPVIETGDNFYQLLEKKMLIQCEFLQANGVQITSTIAKDTAQKAYGFAKGNCQKSGLIITALKRHYRIALVSNFYGNLKTVLADFQLDNLFECVIESAVVGVKKPDPEIFKLACQKLDLPTKDCVVVGDSLKKDMEPALSIGCRAYWLRGRGWEDNASDTASASTEQPYGILDNLTELQDRVMDLA